MPEVNNFGIANGQSTFIRPAPLWINAVSLTGDASVVNSVPNKANYVLFSANSDFWAAVNQGASVPSGNISDGAAGELNPSAWQLNFGSTEVTGIGLISEANTDVTLSFYN